MSVIELNKDNFEKVFKPKNRPSHASWWKKATDESPKNQLARQLALLLMYEMGEK